MRLRSSHNWFSKSGVWDYLNLDLIEFEGDYPFINCEIKEFEKFNTVVCNDYKNIKDDSFVSMFVEDYILERFWNNPRKYVNIFGNAKYVMSPDYSILLNMPKPAQIWNVYRNRFVGDYWQRRGLKVIPTISWADENSYEFCFEGVKKYSAVAVSNIGCRNETHKCFFDNGFYTMIKIIQPETIFFQCNKKFKDFYKESNIIFIDSFWDSKRKAKLENSVLN